MLPKKHVCLFTPKNMSAAGAINYQQNNASLTEE